MEGEGKGRKRGKEGKREGKGAVKEKRIGKGGRNEGIRNGEGGEAKLE